MRYNLFGLAQLLHMDKYLLEQNKSYILSYKGLRRLIGFLGISLPFICIVGGLLYGNQQIEHSISAYYHTNMRDIFVGVIFLMSMFLLTYKGPMRIDNIISSIAGFFGLGIAIFPCDIDKTTTVLKDPIYRFAQDSITSRIGIFQIKPECSSNIHFTCAAIFFCSLSFMSWYLFVKSNEPVLPPRKKIRNTIYRICGSIIFITLLVILTCLLFFKATIESNLFIIICETIMLFVFGVSWLVKGEICKFLNDEPKVVENNKCPSLKKG